MGQAEGYSDFNKSQLYINPTDGTLSVAMKEKKIVDGKEVYVMNQNPNQFTSISTLKNQIAGKYDKFDTNSATDIFVKGLGEEVTTAVTKAASLSSGGIIKSIEDIRNRKDIDPTTKKILYQFSDSENQFIKSTLVNPYDRLSVLTNSQKFAPNGMQYTFTNDAAEAKASPNKILLKVDPSSGQPTPQFNEEQMKVSEDFMRTELRAKYTRKEEQKQTSQSTTRSSSRATAKQDKPAIMLTGDIVGMQRAADAAQDAKVTTSFIKITGDKKRSLGVAIDFTVNAKVGNISVFKSWITQKTARKHIDLVSNSISILPNSFSNTLVYIRIDNVKKVTGLYGVGGMYGTLNKEPLTTLVAIGGGMYKGQLTKNIDAIFILAAVYVPYMKYYTESVFQTKPLLLPFLNVNYKLTKAFRFGLTGGTTYSVTEQLVNYQILFGAKLTL
jgi:hypothetical protein